MTNGTGTETGTITMMIEPETMTIGDAVIAIGGKGITMTRTAIAGVTRTTTVGDVIVTTRMMTRPTPRSIGHTTTIIPIEAGGETLLSITLNNGLT